MVQALAEVEGLLRGVGCSAEAGRALHAQLLSVRSKRLRPALLLLSARLGGGGMGPAVVRAAAAIELLHEATLYHDDIVDEAEERRGQPSVHASVGTAAAALAGSELLYASVELLAELPVGMRRAVGRAGQRLCRGQLRELELIGQPRVSVRDRLRVMRDKTASLFELATRLGGWLGGLDTVSVAKLTRFGRLLGLAYQLADDLRDLCAPAAELGRAPRADLRDGVYTLPVVYALAGRGLSSTVLRCALGKRARGESQPDVDDIVSAIRAGGGVSAAVAQLRRWTDEAIGALRAVSSHGCALTELESLTEGVLRQGLAGQATAAIPGPGLEVPMAGRCGAGHVAFV